MEKSREQLQGSSFVEQKVENVEEGGAQTVQTNGVEQQCSAGSTSFMNDGNTQYSEEIMYRSRLYSGLAGELFEPQDYLLEEELMSIFGAELYSDEDIQNQQLILGITPPNSSFQSTEFQPDYSFAGSAAAGDINETTLSLPIQTSASPLHSLAGSEITSQPTDFNNSFAADDFDIDTILLSPVQNTDVSSVSQPLDLDLQEDFPFTTDEEVDDFIQEMLSFPPEILLSPVHTAATSEITTSSCQSNISIGCKRNSNLDQTMNENKPPGKKRKKKEALPEGVPRRCQHCSTDKTPQWRTGPNGPKTLCNACGVRHKSGRLMPEYRPASSPTFTNSKYSNSHRKVLEIRRQKGLCNLPVQQLYPPLLLPPPPPLQAPMAAAMGMASTGGQNMYLYSAPVASRFPPQYMMGYPNWQPC